MESKHIHFHDSSAMNFHIRHMCFSYFIISHEYIVNFSIHDRNSFTLVLSLTYVNYPI